MSGTAFDKSLVREYLRELDTALARLPARQASELEEQIVAHITDALPGDAPDDEVAALLARLGSPADLVAEADHQPARSRWPAWRNWRLWVVAGPVAALVAVAVGVVIIAETAPVLTASGVEVWWYPQDSARQVTTSADGMTQSTVPIRSGQWQGFVVDLVNTSDETQTVLGPAVGNGLPTAFVGSGGSGGIRGIIGISTPDPEVDGGSGVFTGVRFVLPGVIPPHQTRAMRVLWLSTECLLRGGSSGNDELALRVRIGWIPRTEIVSLGQGWYVSGPSTGKYAC